MVFPLLHALLTVNVEEPLQKMDKTPAQRKKLQVSGIPGRNLRYQSFGIQTRKPTKLTPNPTSLSEDYHSYAHTAPTKKVVEDTTKSSLSPSSSLLVGLGPGGKTRKDSVMGLLRPFRAEV
jgi:hypothetical protein